jgi:hypothetical protein
MVSVALTDEKPKQTGHIYYSINIKKFRMVKKKRTAWMIMENN